LSEYFLDISQNTPLTQIMKINLAKLKSPNIARVKAAIEWNNQRSTGKGNKAKRRMNEEPINSFMNRPFGAVAMNQYEIAKLLKL